MVHSLKTKVIDIPVHCIKCTAMLLQPVDAVGENGSIIKKSEFHSYDFAEAVRGIKSTDFSIANLISVGALNQLKTTFMSYTSGLNVADSFENIKIVPDVQESNV